jgi:hypothetical protein
LPTVSSRSLMPTYVCKLPLLLSSAPSLPDTTERPRYWRGMWAVVRWMLTGRSVGPCDLSGSCTEVVPPTYRTRPRYSALVNIRGCCWTDPDQAPSPDPQYVVRTSTFPHRQTMSYIALTDTSPACTRWVPCPLLQPPRQDRAGEIRSQRPKLVPRPLDEPVPYPILRREDATKLHDHTRRCGGSDPLPSRYLTRPRAP